NGGAGSAVVPQHVLETAELFPVSHFCYGAHQAHKLLMTYSSAREKLGTSQSEKNGGAHCQNDQPDGADSVLFVSKIPSLVHPTRSATPGFGFVTNLSAKHVQTAQCRASAPRCSLFADVSRTGKNWRSMKAPLLIAGPLWSCDETANITLGRI